MDNKRLYESWALGMITPREGGHGFFQGPLQGKIKSETTQVNGEDFQPLLHAYLASRKKKKGVGRHKMVKVVLR